MSYANGTQFYNLPQTVGNDKRDWFDTNSAFAAIDAALHSAVTGQSADAEAIRTINTKLAADEADIAALQTKTTTHDSQIAALQTTVNTQASQIQDVRQDAEDMITGNNEGAAATSTRAYSAGDYFIYNDVLYKATTSIAVGDTIVPNTNCVATNVDTELTQINSDLPHILKTVNADGVKTYSSALNEFFTTLDALSVEKLAHVKLVSPDGFIYAYSGKKSGKFSFDSITPYQATNLIIRRIWISQNSSEFETGTTTFANIASFAYTDMSNTVMSAGEVLTLIG